MKRFAKSMFLAAIVLLMVVSSAFAAGHESIVDIAVEDGRFDTLVAAVVYTDLAEALSDGEWTVFAPTDDAFAKLGLNENNITSAFSKAELTDILLYHVLEGEVNSDKALTLLGDVTMANGQKAGLKAFDGDLFVNDDSKVIIPDILASNGVIHVVDTVVLGPWPRAEAEEDVTVGGGDEAAGNSIVDIAVNNGNFDTLVAAVVYADLADALSGGEWTVFAPTDDAFAELGLNANNISGAFSKAEITDILLYHALEGEVNSDQALTLLGDVTMANGQKAGLKYFDGSLWVNDYAEVIAADVNADNGVIHVVDAVILGPWPAEAE
ncbi:MAG: fasciclin domain-containing protein [Chloroflexota bacterium]|nr:MAG: fasciclin domain-containing protein [Chloroflexota bacterium]